MKRKDRYRCPGCPECNGTGEVDCGCCGSEMRCDLCGGLGFDPSVIDLDAFDYACKLVQALYDYREDVRGNKRFRTVGLKTKDGKVVVKVRDFIIGSNPLEKFLKAKRELEASEARKKKADRLSHRKQSIKRIKSCDGQGTLIGDHET